MCWRGLAQEAYARRTAALTREEQITKNAQFRRYLLDVHMRPESPPASQVPSFCQPLLLRKRIGGEAHKNDVARVTPVQACPSAICEHQGVSQRRSSTE